MMRIIPVKNTKDLFCHYDRQTDSQPCYLEIDCKNETLSCDYNGEIGNAVPFSVYHGHEQRFSIPCLTAKAANEFMAEVLPIAEEIVDGYSSEWDGNNSVAKFDDNAQEALERLARMCDELCQEDDEGNMLEEWDAGDYLDGVMSRYDYDGNCKNWFPHCVKTNIDGVGAIDHTTTDDQLEKMVEQIDDEAGDNVVIHNLEKFLTEERDNCKANYERFKD